MYESLASRWMECLSHILVYFLQKGSYMSYSNYYRCCEHLE
ncbi:rCG23875 [Rattus norvegicus]|uniref:RCG23875 n=1 Tax=Rattus norvegicus TaxID=10116 RepID=A6JVR5_RAT|nr:rCG23875 [Rattus norvegicus]